MQLNLTTNYEKEEKKKKRKVVVEEEEEADVAKSPEKKKSRRIHNGKHQLWIYFVTFYEIFFKNTHIWVFDNLLPL